MKLPVFFLLAVIGCILTCSAQEQGETNIIGGLFTGETSSDATEKPSIKRDYVVKQTFQQSVGGRNVTIQEIEAPELPLVVPEKEDEQLLAPEDNPWLKNTPAVQPMRVIAVSSTIYGTGANKVTRITLHYQGDSYHAWSNIDFRHMQGFSAYKANGREYFILLGAGLARDDQGKIMSINAAYAEGCPSQLTTLGKEVAFIYVPDSEPQSNVKLNQAREILEDMHTLYGKEKVKLAAAYESRVQLAVMNAARAEEIRNTPPGDATIRFWKRDMVKEQQERGAE